jgi:hypothetical protein
LGTGKSAEERTRTHLHMVTFLYICMCGFTFLN